MKKFRHAEEKCLKKQMVRKAVEKAEREEAKRRKHISEMELVEDEDDDDDVILLENYALDIKAPVLETSFRGLYVYIKYEIN